MLRIKDLEMELDQRSAKFRKNYPGYDTIIGMLRIYELPLTEGKAKGQNSAKRRLGLTGFCRARAGVK